MNEDYKNWMKRAESALRIGQTKRKKGIYFEDLCFQLQQAAEKAMKAFLIYKNTEPPKSHSFRFLITKIEEIIHCPDEVKRVIELEDYAVQSRYPGDYSPVGEDEYNEALKITVIVFNWIKTNIIEG